MNTRTDFTMPIPPEVAFVLDRLTSAGYTAYCVGGCVRDCLMGKTPSDYDVTTSAKPDEMQAVFADQRVVETGLKHGTLTVVLGRMNIEITTYRIDGAYGDCRHPESVTFTDRLSDDLCRRDFTVNAMAYSVRDGLVDLFGGCEDLRKKTIRCVGRAEERFSEDGLRILRALRFSSVLGFQPDNECADAVFSLASLLGKISRERIYAEITKMLCGKDSASVMKRFSSVIASAIGVSEESVSRAADYIARDKNEHGTPDPMMRYAWLLSGYGEKEAAAIFDTLKPSRDDKRAMLMYLAHQSDDISGEYGVCRLISSTDDSFPEKLARFLLASGAMTESGYLSVKAMAEAMISQNRCRSLSMLEVNGTDLSAAGLCGKEIGETLSALLDRVMRGDIPNEHNALISSVKIPK